MTADITKLSTAGVDGISANRCIVLSELFAGEALAKADACYIRSDGLVYKAVSTHQATLTGFADFDGFTDRAVKSGQPVSLFGHSAIFGYAAAMTPGQPLFVSSNAGLISDTKVAANDTPIAKAISLTDFKVIK
jgi:hypothetical protein